MGEAEGAAVGLFGGLTFAAALEYFHVSSEGLIVMTVMLVLDFIFGITAAKVRGEAITSSKWQGGLVKKMSRWILPFIVAGGLNRTGMSGVEELTVAIMGMIIFSETYSIIGHIYSLNYKEALPELDAFKWAINGIGKLLKSLITKNEQVILPKDIPSEEEKPEE